MVEPARETATETPLEPGAASAAATAACSSGDRSARTSAGSALRSSASAASAPCTGTRAPNAATTVNLHTNRNDRRMLHLLDDLTSSSGLGIGQSREAPLRRPGG